MVKQDLAATIFKHHYETNEVMRAELRIRGFFPVLVGVESSNGHVASLYRKALDKLRISEIARLKVELSEEDYKKLEGMMWILRKKHECLSKEDKTKLKFFYKHSPTLKQAHSYALKLTQIFNTHSNRKSGIAKLQRWILSVEKSNIICFRTFIKTLKKYMPYIANYFKARQTFGFVEGFNNKIKVAKRRCYGILKTETLFQRLHLDLSGYELFA